MYYKIIYDGVVIDVQNGLDYVTQSPTTKGIIGSDVEARSMGIVSSDGSEIWHLDSLPEFLSGDYQTVTAVQIEKDEYDILLNELASGKEISYDTLMHNDGAEPDKTNIVDLINRFVQCIADADEINVDHEYRLTLLELGITDV